MKTTTIALDVAKRVFQAHLVRERTGEIIREKLKRGQVLKFFANRAACVVAMEACGSAQYWARELIKLGHEVRLIAPQFVRPFVKSNKTDAADAEAIWEAAQRPGMRYVALKSEEQQGLLGLHRLREARVRTRVQLVNQLYGLMGEFGVALPKGWKLALSKAAELLSDAERCVVPAMLREALLQQIEQIRNLIEQAKQLERQIAAWQRQSEPCRRLIEIPGVGVLTATAVVATMGDPASFKSGRQFAAFLGLVPRQSGTGGRMKLLGISKRGDPYVRKLLIHGARSVLRWQRAGRRTDRWVQGLLERRPVNVAAVALANKTARTIWALLARGRAYQPRYMGRELAAA